MQYAFRFRIFLLIIWTFIVCFCGFRLYCFICPKGSDEEQMYHPNLQFRQWLRSTFFRALSLVTPLTSIVHHGLLKCTFVYKGDGERVTSECIVSDPSFADCLQILCLLWLKTSFLIFWNKIGLKKRHFEKLYLRN